VNLAFFLGVHLLVAQARRAEQPLRRCREPS
jgi:hypothetical protein